MGWREEADAVARAIAGARVSGSGWIRINCPLCVDRVGKVDRRASLGVNAESGGFKCFRCHAKGRARGFGPSAQRPEREAPTVETADLPRGYVPLWEGPGATSALTRYARSYLRRRNVSDRAVREARVGWCDYRGPRVVVPVHDGAMRLRGWVARTLADREPRYLNAGGGWASETVFNAAALYRHGGPLLVVEGVFDALPYWPDAVAVLGKPTPEQVAVIAESRRPIAVCLDGDAHNEGWALARRLNLQGVRAGAVRLPPTTDPATVDRRWLLNAAGEAVGAHP